MGFMPRFLNEDEQALANSRRSLEAGVSSIEGTPGADLRITACRNSSKKISRWNLGWHPGQWVGLEAPSY